MSRPARLPLGLRPLSRAERKRVAAENARALFPSLLVQRLLVTIAALESELAVRP